MLKGFAALMDAIHNNREGVLNDPDRALKDVPEDAQKVIRGMSELELLVLARPHMLPTEIGMFPHGRGEVVDPGDALALAHALEQVKVEVDRRRQSGGGAHSELVLVPAAGGPEPEPDPRVKNA
jgi:hypothetical protein